MFCRCGLAVPLLVLLSLAAPGRAAAQLTEERSQGLRVIYFDGTEGYLLPHATRTALNSLAFQKKLFRRRLRPAAGPERLR